jgi:hypothetical protein
VCRIDIEKAKKTFTDRCVISRWHDEYRLYRTFYKKAIALKAAISKEDAEKLIRELNLVEVPSYTFRHACEYRVQENGDDLS